MRKNVLICGPWVGEFGWELFAWQAYMRQMSKNYDKVVCISRPTSKALYSDYADEFIPYTPEGGLADSFFMHDHKVDHKFLNSVFSQNSDYNVTWLPPRRVGVPPHTHFKEPILFGYTRVSPEYIKFGESVKRGNDIVIHARNRELRQADNWEIENWNQLVTDLKSLGHKVISIGTKKQSSHIKGTKDMRGVI